MNNGHKLSDPRLKIFLSNDIEFSDLSKIKIEKVLSLEDIQEIIVLPDIHSKPDNPFPTGIVTLTSNTIYPSAIGQEIGCGMRILKTSLNIQDVNFELIDDIFTYLKQFLRDKERRKPIFTKDDYLQILIKGYGWLKERFGIERESDIDLEKKYNFFKGKISTKDIISAIPKDAIWAGYYRLGSLGGGNHFLEMQVVDNILDESVAKKIGLTKGQIVFLFHTGSGSFSKRLDNYYGIRFENNRMDKELRKNFRKLLFHFNDFRFLRLLKRWRLFFKKDFRGIPVNSYEGKRYVLALQIAMNYSLINRSIISGFIENALKQVFKDDSPLQLLNDTSHECIDYEEFNGRKFWVHRNGATKVNHPYSGVTEILPIPGFMGGPSFLCVADEGIIDARNSVNHGVGRIFTKQEAKSRFPIHEIYNSLKINGIYLFKLGDEDLREQAPHAFKDIQTVITALKNHRLIRPVVITAPLAILKG
jgi:tRNA-splicing ligase RtcB